MKRYVEIVTNSGKIYKIIYGNNITEIREKIYKILLTTAGEIYSINISRKNM